MGGSGRPPSARGSSVKPGHPSTLRFVHQLWWGFPLNPQASESPGQGETLLEILTALETST